MKCDNCGKGRPTFWNQHGKFCNFSCFLQWKKKKGDRVGLERNTFMIREKKRFTFRKRRVRIEAVRDFHN